MRSQFEEVWRRRFTERGRLFDDDAGIAGWTDTGLETRLRHFQRVWPGDEPGARWLDVGCGAGSYTRYLAEQGVAPLGADYSLPSVQKARLRSEAAIEWMVADATRLPLKPGTMDGVMCFGVMQALSGPEQAVTELVAATRPGGQVWIDALNRGCLTTLIKRLLARLRRRPLNLRYDDPQALAALLEQVGAEQVRVYWIPILPGRLSRFQPWVESGVVHGLLQRLPWLGALLSHAFLVSARKGEHS
ncbi:class I SAM-dependent methyltransferase [Ectothiorhodospira variabilis]|uniref:class I SAM-dependent methyltransferase n=1 Tax=Ectothiorhodospira variabilis TaxID=505694 RepID=UPI001EFC2C99|nr:class I SAM-dependent methyltransferase [Ectothiorhodospira variabilis]MCG5494762.1 class I SAM-dependent methyltransferase [Ectothiorhodospira variabilis]MCG5504349.1 class I SAM-dependent methyltransferase [Ectothiorhodospira variabilis]MCG5507504.1 class I SAM-dependent methyltransferase [Ectothiorhodospira variabilis]